MKFALLVIIGVVFCGCVNNSGDSNPLLRTIADVNSSDAEAIGCLRKMSAEPAKEKISFWLKIIQDSRYSDFRRRECLFELFSRHVVSGMPVNELQRLNHVLKFSSSNLTDVSPFAIKTPIRSRNTGSIYMFQNFHWNPPVGPASNPSRWDLGQ
jgi:hypothetical protein